MNIPLSKVLKKRAHLELALLQDEAIDIVYNIDDEVVFHGGTCIWRCFQGKRFSEDLDLYSTKITKEKLEIESKKRGLKLIKYKETENSIYSKISNGESEVSIEFALRKIKGTICDYEKVDGSKILINALTKNELILEKAKAFASRKLIRDIYDVFFLTTNQNIVEIKQELSTIINTFPEPVDEKNLKTLIYSGPAPTFKDMITSIKNRVK
ncbi:MAG TPA: nucleotidyl transferase AbiEii/AbiGii toxin family protein [archaeon]|nr:nucleotidyl transferase AbiEii/AbiGii toxin family protein [archaeon]